jgi:hypothetical protein
MAWRTGERCAANGSCVGVNETSTEFEAACQASNGYVGIGRSAIEHVVRIGDVKDGQPVDGITPLAFSKIAIAQFFGEIRDGAYELK